MIIDMHASCMAISNPTYALFQVSLNSEKRYGGGIHRLEGQLYIGLPTVLRQQPL